jgi:hypothetical protein
MNIPASFPGFPQRPFVFNNIPGSFVQKKVCPSNCHSLLRVGSSKDATANKSHFADALRQLLSTPNLTSQKLTG